MGGVQFSPLSNIGGIIVGAETGNRRDKVKPTAGLIKALTDECDAYGVYKGNSKMPVFMKDSLIPIVGEENMRRELQWEVQR